MTGYQRALLPISSYCRIRAPQRQKRDDDAHHNAIPRDRLTGGVSKHAPRGVTFGR